MIKNQNNSNHQTNRQFANSMALSSIKKIVTDKNVLYIATTYLDYIRVQQEISLLNKYAKNVYIIVSTKKSYIVRLVYVYLKSLFFFKKNDVVFIGFAPQLVLPFLKWRFRNKSIIIDFFISLHDTLVMDRKKFRQGSMFSRLLKYIDKLTLRWADNVICDTNAHASYFVNELECDKNKIHTLYLEADSKYYYPKIVNKPANLRDKYVVLYFGSVLPLQGTNVIIDAINLCKNKNIFYIMVGPFDNSCSNCNVRFVNWLTQDELSEYIAFSDLCLAGHFNSQISKASRTIPGKAYIYEAMRKKIILGNNVANKERYPGCYGNVKFVKMGEPTALNEVITNCYQEFNSEK